MTFDDFKTLCETRRSIRYFGDKPVSKQEILSLLNVASLAPNIENLQPWHFHVIFNQELRKEFMKSCCYGNFVEGADVFIVITANMALENKAKEIVWNPKELEYSCMAAAENIMLGATAMGLGSCWVSLHHGAAHAALGLKAHELIVGGLMIGHFRRGEEQPSNGRQRKPIEEVSTVHE